MLHLVTDAYLGEMTSAAVQLAVRVEGEGASLWLRLPPATFPPGFPEGTSWRLRLADEARAWDFASDDGNLRELLWEAHEVSLRIVLPADWRTPDSRPALLLGGVHDVVLVPTAR